MNRWLWAIGMICSVGVAGQTAALTSTNYYLVAELTNTAVHMDSFVIGLTNAAQIAHAQALIAQGPTASSTIVFANVAAGADGINRDHLNSEAPAWSWHVTQVTGFGDMGIELIDGWPTLLESDVPGWMKNTGGHIGFWSYTVSAALPFSPRIEGITQSQDGIVLSVDKLTPPFPLIVETSTNLTDPVWTVQSRLVPQHSKSNLFLPMQAGTAFIRLRVGANP